MRPPSGGTGRDAPPRAGTAALEAWAGVPPPRSRMPPRHLLLEPRGRRPGPRAAMTSRGTPAPTAPPLSCLRGKAFPFHRGSNWRLRGHGSGEQACGSSQNCSPSNRTQIPSSSPHPASYVRSPPSRSRSTLLARPQWRLQPSRAESPSVLQACPTPCLSPWASPPSPWVPHPACHSPLLILPQRAQGTLDQPRNWA